MWAMARVDLGLDESSFWRLTPRQFDALIRRKNQEYDLLRQREERADYRVALLCSVIVNINRPKNKKRAKPEDFLGRTKEKKRTTWQEQLAFVERLNIALGGRDLRPKGGEADGTA